MLTHNDKIVIASANPGKLREFSALLANYDFQAIPQQSLQISSPEETGLSFVENAIIKARHAAQESGLPALADDSGIEIDALNGKPGIYSARFAGPNASDQQNNDKVLQQLANVDSKQRSARYQCVIVLMRNANDSTPLICQGSWEGFISNDEQGDGGFGYDPLFWLPEYNCTAAQITAEQKNKISHRAKAMQQLLDQLRLLAGK